MSSTKESSATKLYHRIGEVSKLLGVETHVLRYWEREFELKPHRSNSGQRLYRQPEIERFREVKSLIYDRGFTIAGARKVLEEQHGTQLNVDQIRLLVTQLQTIQLKLRSLQRELEQKSL